MVRALAGVLGFFLFAAVARAEDAALASEASPDSSVTLVSLMHSSAQLDLYANYGHGLLADEQRASGLELGTRARLFEHWDLVFAYRRLDCEPAAIDEEGTSEGEAAIDQGVELGSRVTLSPALSADLSVRFYPDDDFADTSAHPIVAHVRATLSLD